MSSPPHILLITVDRLGAGWLGPYGNTSVSTPVLNRFAAQSLVSEFTLSDSYRLGDVMRSYVHGLPSFCKSTPIWPSLPQIAKEHGYDSLLLSDDSAMLDDPAATQFEQQSLFEIDPAKSAAKSLEDTRAWRFMQVAAKALSQLNDRPSFLWAHFSGTALSWDAPYEFRERLAAEEDPDPLTFVDPPSLTLPRNYNPDELLGITQAYAAQVSVTDASLQPLLDAADRHWGRDDTLVVFTSPRGMAMGEHLGVGLAGDALRGEVLHVPLILRYPSGNGSLIRTTGLQAPCDVYVTLAKQMGGQCNGWGNDLTGELACVPTGRPWLLAKNDTELALRTQAWFYRRLSDSEEADRQLYAKPDDRWEANEVSARAVAICDAAEAVLPQLIEQTQSLTPPEITLPDELLTPL